MGLFFPSMRALFKCFNHLSVLILLMCQSLNDASPSRKFLSFFSQVGIKQLSVNLTIVFLMSITYSEVLPASFPASRLSTKDGLSVRFLVCERPECLHQEELLGHLVQKHLCNAYSVPGAIFSSIKNIANVVFTKNH